MLKIKEGHHYKARNGKCYYSFTRNPRSRNNYFIAKFNFDDVARDAGFWSLDGKHYSNEQYNLIQEIDTNGNPIRKICLCNNANIFGHRKDCVKNNLE